jgi:hypothetical protein
MAARKVKISADVLEKFEGWEDATGVLNGFEFVETHDLNEEDNHGSSQYLLILRKVTTGQLFAGEFTISAGEGEREFADYVYPVDVTEKTIVVREYTAAE